MVQSATVNAPSLSPEFSTNPRGDGAPNDSKGKQSRKRRQARSVLTTIRKAKHRLHWKQSAMIFIVGTAIVIVVIVCGAFVVLGLQKVEWRNRVLRCDREKSKRQELLKQTCVPCEKTTEDCEKTRRECKKMFEEFYASTKKCFGLTATQSRSVNTFRRAVIYAFSVFTTIGEGQIVIRSTAGKYVSMVYALISIPLFFVFVNQMGKWCHYGLIRTYEKLRSICGAGKKFAVTPTEPEDGGIFVFALTTTSAYLCLASTMYMHMQDWTFAQAFYFAFQSAAMIGFGDVYAEREDWSFVLIHMIITVVGIILLAMVTHIIREWYFRAVRKVGQRIGDKIGFKPKSKGSTMVTAVAADDDTMKRVNEEVSFGMMGGNWRDTGGKRSKPGSVRPVGQAKRHSRKEKMQSLVLLDNDHLESLLRIVSDWLPNSLVVYHWLKILCTATAPKLDGSACYVDQWPDASRVCCVDPVVYEGLPRSYFLSFAVKDKTNGAGFVDFLRCLDTALRFSSKETHAVCGLSLPQDLANSYCSYFRERKCSVKHYENDAYWVPSESHRLLARASIQPPTGFYFDTVRLDEAEDVDEMWPHRWIGSLPLTVRKVRYMPNVCLRRWDGHELCSFEIMHSEFGMINHLYTRPQYRRQGLARAVEFRQMQRALESGFVPYKYVVRENEPPVKLTATMGFWRKYGQYPFVEVFTPEGAKMLQADNSNGSGESSD